MNLIRLKTNSRNWPHTQNGSFFRPKSQNDNFDLKSTGYGFVHCQIFLARPYGGGICRNILMDHTASVRKFSLSNVTLLSRNFLLIQMNGFLQKQSSKKRDSSARHVSGRKTNDKFLIVVSMF